MVRKKQALTMMSIAVMSFLVGATFSTSLMALASDENGIPFARIWEAIYDLQDRVTALEESANGNSRTWHFVTSFTLSDEDWIEWTYGWKGVSPLFLVQGEKWRIRWEPETT